VTDTNPLLREFDLPPYSDIRPEHVEPAVDTILGDNRVALQELLSRPAESLDWGTLVVEYRGAALDHASLLAYLVSFRQHADFHEQCVERIFLDLQRLLKPEWLTVYARYVRRGGLDINPYRSSAAITPENRRLVRQ
jgi:hypothetical protein